MTLSQPGVMKGLAVAWLFGPGENRVLISDLIPWAVRPRVTWCYQSVHFVVLSNRVPLKRSQGKLAVKRSMAEFWQLFVACKGDRVRKNRCTHNNQEL